MADLPQARARLAAGEQVTIVFLGDSNTALTFHTHGWLNVVGLVEAAIFQTYGDNRARVINAGSCGGTVEAALARLDRDVLRFQPDLVFVGFGMNDQGHGPALLESRYLGPMRELVRRLRAAGAEVVLRTSNPVVCVNGPGASAGEVPGREFPGTHLAAYNRALVGLAAELGCPVVDHYLLWLRQEYPPNLGVNNPNGIWQRMSDKVHPNEIGHRAFYRELAPLLGLPTVLPWEV